MVIEEGFALAQKIKGMTHTLSHSSELSTVTVLSVHIFALGACRGFLCSSFCFQFVNSLCVNWPVNVEFKLIKNAKEMLLSIRQVYLGLKYLFLYFFVS